MLKIFLVICLVVNIPLLIGIFEPCNRPHFYHVRNSNRHMTRAKSIVTIETNPSSNSLRTCNWRRRRSHSNRGNIRCIFIYGESESFTALFNRITVTKWKEERRHGWYNRSTEWLHDRPSLQVLRLLMWWYDTWYVSIHFRRHCSGSRGLLEPSPDENGQRHRMWVASSSLIESDKQP